jgi:hypothetical protein
MPLATKRKKPDPNAIYVAWESVALALPGSPVVRRGTRLRGDDPIVQAAPEWFLPDGTDDREVQRRIAAHYADTLEVDEPPPAPPEPPLRDEDAVVALRDIDVKTFNRGSPPQGRELATTAGVRAEDKVAKSDAIVRKHRDAFIAVNPDEISRSEAVVAQQTLSSYDPERDELRVIHAGQWMRRDDPLARVHRHLVRPPDPEPWTP